MVKKITLILLCLLLTSCSQNNEVKMATTTSLNDSGLLGVLSDAFYEETNIKLQWISVGSGEAIEIAKSGEVAITFLHAPSLELEFENDGYSLGRNVIMQNNFLLVGPEKLSSDNLEEVVEIIANDKLYISRADNSGTHKQEQILFDNSIINVKETGLGMGATLQIANELNGYTLVDYATWQANKASLDLVEVYYNTNNLENIYSLHLVNHQFIDKKDQENAKQFLEFIESEKGQTIIREFGKEEFGEAVFIIE